VILSKAKHIYKAFKPELLLLAAFLFYGFWLIFRTSFVIDGIRYWCLFDDSMISMAYAKNLVSGLGLNWARFGNPVEGYTHPLWVLIMIIIHLLPFKETTASLPIQLISLSFLVLNLYFVGKITKKYFASGSRYAYFPAVILTAAYFPLNLWALRGMETGLQALLVTSSIYYLLAAMKDLKNNYIVLAVLQSLGLLLRMDMVILVVVINIFLFVHFFGKKKELLQYLIIIFLPSLVYELFRIAYFHDIWPNTYYLKIFQMPLISRLLSGSISFINFINIFPIILLLIIYYVAIHRNNVAVQVIGSVVTGFFLYSIYVGGDVWENVGIVANRFTAFVMPLIFILTNALLIDFTNVKNLVGRFKTQIILFATIFLVLLFNSLWNFKDFNIYSTQAQMFLGITKPYGSPGQKEVIIQTLNLNKLFSENAKVAVTQAGVTAYFGKFKLIDLFGYNDSYVAKLPPAAKPDANDTGYLPGHSKYDFKHSVKDLSPDVLMHFDFSEDIKAQVASYGYEKIGPVFVKATTTEADLQRLRLCLLASIQWNPQCDLPQASL